MPTAAGLAAYASVNALAVATTPASSSVAPIAPPVSPAATVTWTSPLPGPG